MLNKIKEELYSHKVLVETILETMQDDLMDVSNIFVETFKNGNKVLICGNGGSASDAQHISAELVGRYKKERKGLPAIALTTDSSILTAVSNDYSYNYVFERQVEALANKGDLIIGISTSGKSENIINALKKAKELECKTLGLTGKGGGTMKNFCDYNLIVPSNDTPRIQEIHILFGHILCEIVDIELK